MSASGQERWVRRFLVGEACPHPSGFTLYSITSYLFPRSSPETLTVVKVWKRYSDLQRLQQKISKTHRALYLKGTCPNYAKWSYFKRFDLEVIEERKKATQALLEFIALYPPLFTCLDFVNFFKSSHPDPKLDTEINPPGNIAAIRSSLLLPIEATSPIEYQSSEEDSFSIMDSPISPADKTNMENIILPQQNIIQPVLTTNRMPSSDNINDNIDNPTNKIETIAEDTDVIEPNSSLNEIIFTNNKAVVTNRLNLPDLISFDKHKMEDSQISSDSNDSMSGLNGMDLKNCSLLKEASSDNPLWSDMNKTDMNQSIISSQSDRSIGDDVTDSVLQNRMNLTRSSSRMDSLSIDSAFSSSMDLQENYIFEAGFILRLGAKCESKREYSEAFDYYKSAIEKMLIGAQGDGNELRREFVKDKIAKYLSHSEKIYTSYLNNPVIEMTEYNSISDEMTKSIEQSIKSCNLNDLSKPYNELGKYRVLGIIGGNMLLVLCSDNQQCLAMKIIEKTSNQISDDDYFSKGFIDNKLPVLPVKIPYMIKLTAYIETTNLLFLVLQYASGGKLFDYITNHIKSVPQTPSREVNLNNVFINLDTLNQPSMSTSETILQDCDNIECNDNKLSIESTNNSECDPCAEVLPCEDDDNLSVTDMVINSQKLLLNVDDALSGRFLQKSEDNEDPSDHNQMNLMVNEVEKAFDGIQEKLEQIVGENYVSDESSNTCALPPKVVSRWGAELLTAICHLHRYGIIIRTLNPDNLLLGDRGQLLLSYVVGREVQDILLPLLNMVNSNGLHNVYIAPELQQFSFLDEQEKLEEKLCDFWSFGAIMYELIVGKSLSKMHPTGIYSHTILNFPEDIDGDSEVMLSQLLTFNPRERLGSGPTGIEEIKSHPYFKYIDWNRVEEDFIYEK